MRHLKTALLTLISAALVGCSGGGASESGAAAAGEGKSTSFFAMDTYMTVTVYDGDSEKALAAAKESAEVLERRISVTDEGSEIYLLDHSSGEAAEVSEETAELIDFALDMNEQTEGALDITLYPVLREWGFTTGGEYSVPSAERISELLENTGCDRIVTDGVSVTVPEGMQIDLGSIGKGYAGDKMTEALKQNGVTSALLDLGGNIQLIGSKPDGSSWKIGLKSPYGTGDNLAKLELTDCCVITSGGYERYFTDEDGTVYWHILDPKTGYPAHSGIISATVIGKSGKVCDALSTSLFVMGEERAKELWRKRGDFEMILVTDDGRIILTPALSESFTLYEQYSDMSVEVTE